MTSTERRGSSMADYDHRKPEGNVPELPEVERGRRLAEAVAVGHRIERVWCDADPIVFDGVAPERWRHALEGRRVAAARRWGKQLWLERRDGRKP